MNEITTSNGSKCWMSDSMIGFIAGSIVDHTLFSKDVELSRRYTEICFEMIKDGTWFKNNGKS